MAQGRDSALFWGHDIGCDGWSVLCLKLNLCERLAIEHINIICALADVKDKIQYQPVLSGLFCSNDGLAKSTLS